MADPTSPTTRRSNSGARSPSSTPSSGSSSAASATRPPPASSGSLTSSSRMSAKLLDRVLETPIAPSFTRIGAVVRSRTEHWTDLDDYDLSGRTILLTGATSGLGLAAAHRLAGLGAKLLVVGRNPAKTDAAYAALPSPTGATHTPCTPRSWVSTSAERTHGHCSSNRRPATSSTATASRAPAPGPSCSKRSSG